MTIVLSGFALCASASNYRQETLQTCTRQATDQSLSGDAYAEFMRGCLKAPRDAKPPVYAASAASRIAPGQAIRPAMVQPAKPDRPAKAARQGASAGG
ncbi:PsiF family protein [Aquabacterium sp.]|uniref:PsiF family protein n=1 Tax=Aquabacterium sp. TaxID=1872578 RepID=UPI0025C170F1|nr:PsiF family protein [Aquabacterium sp.]